MPASLITGLCPDVPCNIIPTINGDVLLANGIDRVRRWDGKTTSAEEAGMPASVATAPTATITAGGSATLGAHICAYRWLDRDRVPGNMSLDTSVTAAGANLRVAWSNYVPTGSVESTRPVTVQLFRSLAGGTGVLYLAREEAISGSANAYNDDASDATLATAEAVVIVNDDASEPATGYKYGQPPWHMSAFIPHLGRMYAAVPVPYSIGHVEVVNGSTAVKGIGTNWSSGMIPNTNFITGSQFARRFRVVGETAENTISAVGSANTLTLSAAFAGTSKNFGKYAIYTPDTELLAVYYTPVGEPESWPENYFFSAKPEGGPNTALILAGSQLYIAKRSKMMLFTVASNPATDGACFPADGHRGCENQRTWCSSEGYAYVMDRQGIYAWDGGKPREIGEAIGDLFSKNKINWEQSRWFRACYDPERSTVRFAVCLGSSLYPKHVLNYSVRTGSWWHDEYETGIGGAAMLKMANRRRFVMGTEHARIQVSGDSNLDGVTDSTAGTLRGTVTSAGLFTLTDSTAVFSSTLVGTYVGIVDGRGKGQRNRITSVSDTQLVFQHPWKIIPNTTSTYQVGGFKAVWKGPLLRLTQRAADTSREVHVNYDPTDSPSHAFAEVTYNRNRQPATWGSGSDQAGEKIDSNNGVTRRGADPSIHLNFYRKQHIEATAKNERYDDEGYRRFVFDGNCDVNGSGDRSMTLGLWTHAAKDGVKIYSLAIDGCR